VLKLLKRVRRDLMGMFYVNKSSGDFSWEELSVSYIFMEIR